MLKEKKKNEIKKENNKNRNIKTKDNNAYQKVLVINENSESEQEFHKLIICKKCEKPIKTERALKIDDFYFHTEHLKCTVCSRIITEEFIYFENHFWCKNCSKSARRICNDCNKKIESDTSLFADHKFYHDNHFLCSRCNGKIINSNEQQKEFGKMKINDSVLYLCYNCVQKISRNSCSRCGSLIQNDQHYVKSRKGIWHIGCFICSICEVSLLKFQSYCEYDGLLYCVQHIPKDVEIVSKENCDDDDDDDGDYDDSN
ncbi:hypothetical protein H8356DRAFT_1678067 [Neocallimastix lanati (nom. inval.)]|jgi:hypothetical protein|uniref:LIM zinc-binding domain-containing protein n=1 Tax=Neocallimastix californiae TaxID=1754190 RepID=A0A1Y2ABK0_9FUNG|nr:hypothetical protein H8356DRAFT_1678067 [Neocallimastix sp. JGI-2020a]ORY19929.1 hypothetical protein LY90DRAFT_162668 [Neocallimastix californiae]|eukprot:ORY19929.1 hypothetical protein LY90DRAFT_162668 [Neocallimastix californiae]